MKKYFMKGTEEELQFGDEIALDLTKKLPNGYTLRRHMKCTFVDDEETIKDLVDAEVIEVVDEEDDEPVDFENSDNTCPYDETFDSIFQNQEELEKKVEGIEKDIKALTKLIMEYMEFNNAKNTDNEVTKKNKKK